MPLVAGQHVWVWTGGEHPSLPFLVGVTRKVSFLPAGGESLSVSMEGTGRSPRQARTNMWLEAEMPRTPRRDEGAAAQGGGGGSWGVQQQHLSGWPAVSRHCWAATTTLPLSLQQGQPVPTTSLEQGTEVHPGEGSALAGGCWQPPPPCSPLGEWQCRCTWCAGQMCAGDEGMPVSWS